VARVALFLLLTLTGVGAKTWMLHIDGMHCIACTLAVKKALLSVDGVSQAKVNFKNETAIVEAQESVRLKNMQEAVEKTGYRLR
jgi:copper chaperone CopZ